MRMQGPEQGQPFGQEWQSSQEHDEYRTDYTGRYYRAGHTGKESALAHWN